jgi:nitronate monooxygenase
VKSFKIGKHIIRIPIVQGGMGVGISWDNLAGTVSKEGGLGVISAVGTGYYGTRFVNKQVKGRPFEAENFYSRDALFEIFKNARKICANAPIAANVLYAINDYGRVVVDACEAGANAIITGAGLPTNMPEFTKNFPDVALIPIVSSAKALRVIIKRWERYKKTVDAVIVEGPKSGGHQGFKYEDCFKDEFQLENIVPPIIDEVKKYAGANIPVIAAGGIWDKSDIGEYLNMGCSGVQMGTRFIGTHECDASAVFKKVILDAKEEDIKLEKSPVGYPARAVTTKLIQKIHDEKQKTKIACVSNCVAPCNRGEEANKVGYCIADSLGDSCNGDLEKGLFFSGSNGYKLDKLISVKELMKELTD